MLQLHELWLQYTQTLARGASASAGGAGAAAARASAPPGPGTKGLDLHGARVRVVEHSNPQLVGAEGVVLRLSRAAMQLVTPEERLRGARVVSLWSARPRLNP
jgi:hypothetical protein